MSARAVRVASSAVALGFVLALVGLSNPASAGVGADREPNPCAGRSTDSGTGSSFPEGNYFRIIGTWYNCGGGTGADRVKIDVINGGDGDCITVPYGTDKSDSFTRAFSIGTPGFRGWLSC